MCRSLRSGPHTHAHDAKEWFKAKVADVKAWVGKPGIMIVSCPRTGDAGDAGPVV
jgi:hypothetical protein